MLEQTDSTMGWIGTPPGNLNPSVANRFSKIQELTEVNSWRHVPTELFSNNLDMEWFGLTLYGTQNPIKDMMRCDYVEPTVPKNLLESYQADGSKGGFADLIREVDVYIGQADGYAYKSYDRLTRMRNKGNFKPVGPTDMYRYPGCCSMEYGWFLADRRLEGETWYRGSSKYC